MSDTLILIIVFAGLMFFMHRGHGGMGGCGGGHSHGSHQGNGQSGNQSAVNSKEDNEHQH